jgi:hypothetical protein
MFRVRLPFGINSLREISTPIFPVPPPFPKLTLSRYRIYRQACRRGGTGAGCEGQTQNLTVRVRENGLPPWLADPCRQDVSPLQSLDVPVRHTTPSQRLEDGRRETGVRA